MRNLPREEHAAPDVLPEPAPVPAEARPDQAEPEAAPAEAVERVR